MSCFHTSRGCAENLNRHCGSDLGQGVVYVQRSTAKAKRKQQNFVISGTIFHQNVFPLRESNSILFGKVKEFTFEALFRSPFTEQAFHFHYKKEFMLKVLI